MEQSLHHHLQHGLQGNLCSGTWITSSPSLFFGPGVFRVVSLKFFSLLFLKATVQCSLSFLQLLSFIEAPAVLLTGSTLASNVSVAEPACTGCVTWDSPWLFPTEATTALLHCQHLALETPIQGDTYKVPSFCRDFLQLLVKQNLFCPVPSLTGHQKLFQVSCGHHRKNREEKWRKSSMSLFGLLKE